MPQLSFLGAARTVTGSKHLVEAGAHRVLADCGLFQGLKELRLRNWDPLPVDAASIHAVVLTHAHLDHSGHLPRLVGGGFRGRIFCTPGTADLCRLVLPDAGRLQEEDARQAYMHGYTRHAPALPLFTEADAFQALSQLQPVGFERPVPVASGIEGEFVNAGHLLGSAMVRMGSSATADRGCCSGAIWVDTTGPCCQIRSRRPNRTWCWSSPRTATGCTGPTMTRFSVQNPSAKRVRNTSSSSRSAPPGAPPSKLVWS